MLALGTYDNFDDIHEMALEFFQASPYTELGIDHDRVAGLIHTFLNADPKDKVTILWLSDGKPVGLLAAIAETNLFNTRRVACEVMWWINPEHRKNKAAEEMRSAYEFWAKKAGCQFCTLVDLLGNLDTYYKRKGYERRETSYIKVL